MYCIPMITTGYFFQIFMFYGSHRTRRNFCGKFIFHVELERKKLIKCSATLVVWAAMSRHVLRGFSRCPASRLGTRGPSSGRHDPGSAPSFRSVSTGPDPCTPAATGLQPLCGPPAEGTWLLKPSWVEPLHHIHADIWDVQNHKYSLMKSLNDLT